MQTWVKKNKKKTCRTNSMPNSETDLLPSLALSSQNSKHASCLLAEWNHVHLKAQWCIIYVTSTTEMYKLTSVIMAHWNPSFKTNVRFKQKWYQKRGGPWEGCFKVENTKGKVSEKVILKERWSLIRVSSIRSSSVLAIFGNTKHC